MPRGKLLAIWGLAVVCVFGVTAVLAAVLPRTSPRPDQAGVGAEPGSDQAGRLASGLSGGPGPRARWVIDENARPGSEGWRLTPGEGLIEGFADAVSAQQGDRVGLYVSTTAPDFHVEAYRMGYYRGLGGRLVWRSPPVTGVRQAEPVRDRVTNMVEAPWSRTMSVAVDRRWPPGDYLLKLVARTGAQSYVPLTVRDDTSRAAYVVQNAVTTWQAYNLWGGYSLYEGREGGRADYARRSRVVSFDRPYSFGGGAADFLGNELPLVSLVESLGLDVTYWTDVDLHRQPQLLTNHRVLVTLGHDEYWSQAMRRGAERARDQGVNLVFLGANAVFRQIRFEPSPLGPDRREVGYKVAREDPMTRTNPSLATINWRDPPVNDPESKLVGNFYECNPVKADMVIADASAWVFAGTGLRNGDRLSELVGPEYDRYNPEAPPPPGPVQVLARSPLTCRGTASHSDMTYYTLPGGAGVFATGTNWWISRLTGPCPAGECRSDEQVTRITQNVLEAFGAGPAGRAHPSVSNVGQLGRVVPRPSTTRAPVTTVGEGAGPFGPFPTSVATSPRRSVTVPVTSPVYEEQPQPAPTAPPRTRAPFNTLFPPLTAPIRPPSR